MLDPAVRNGKKFENPVPTSVGDLRILFKLLPLYFSSKEERVPSTPLGPFHTDPAAYATKAPGGLRVTWFGHSSLLLEIDGFRLLTDPVWGERASPVSWGGPKRFFPPTLPLAELPPDFSKMKDRPIKIWIK